jgi:hypothetical protein
MSYRPLSLSAVLLGDLAALVTLLGNGELNTSALGEGDPRLVALSSDEDVSNTGNELVVQNIADVDGVETSDVTLTVNDDTRTTHVTSTGGHNKVTGLEL